MSDSDDVVVVEHPTLTTGDATGDTSAAADADAAVPQLQDEDYEKEERPLQIVSIGTEADAYAFRYDEAAVQTILAQVPANCPVAVLSVVGAFRTGKSFLLSWFLRYLHHLSSASINQDSTSTSTSTNTYTNNNKKKWYDAYQTLGNNGFEWKAGSERNTTGIWMWSRPFLLNRPSDDDVNNNNNNNNPLALLLVDTQGMFDHETTMNLTASIFGFSTLLSSFQIYNVDKRIQEDNLQQLALFSEYARMAMSTDNKNNKNENKTKQADVASKKDKDDNATKNPTRTPPPFQRMEFLVRDWQHFEDEDETLEKMEASMEQYLKQVLQERDAADLKDTRQQIVSCFADISCYGLCHPGFAVTKRKFTGDVTAMEDLFVKLLDRYCQRVMKALQPKQIHGRDLTAVELGSYISAYANLFVKGAHFPTAVTLLEATAATNNTNAANLGFAEYQYRMDRVAGPQASNYMNSEELELEHAAAVRAATRIFDDMATFGSQTAIATSKRTLQDKIHKQYQVYESLNDSRNPLKGMELFLIPLFVALVSYVVKHFLDFTCAPHATLCKVGSEAAGHAYAFGFCFLVIAGAARSHQVKEYTVRFWRAMELLFSGTNTPVAGGGGTKRKAE
uniref:GB1/RHD3-type G domain-containing protein n=1 Tax=Amphora coffeiformis TaxID=265554 RepID=A0A7S3L446_9STRA